MKRLLCLLLTSTLILSASAIIPSPDPDVVEHQPRNETPVEEASYTKIFLAGTIDMGNSVDWQRQTIELFRERNDGRYLFFNPRRGGKFDPSPENMNYQVRWELEHLEQADVIVMNLLGSSKSPISLLEMGIHIRSGKLRVACEPNYYRYDNVRITCEHYGVPLYHSLKELIEANFKPAAAPAASK